MPSDIAIHVGNLGKMYRIGKERPAPKQPRKNSECGEVIGVIGRNPAEDAQRPEPGV